MKNDVNVLRNTYIGNLVKVVINHKSMIMSFQSVITEINESEIGEIVVHFENNSVLRFFNERIDILGNSTNEGDPDIALILI